ncbi:MAG: hypothetical protein C0469_08340 [Cyanobacteria bacterium DS2.3.42]|nr:hypothetical protein [Cyanobacteria bacterium DS2.3.42]
MSEKEYLNSQVQNQEGTATKIVESAAILAFKPGVIILERFKIIELLGRGGMGSVYKVENIETGKIFALKFLHKQQTNDATWRRFDIEAKTANKLDHPNLVKVHETGLLPDGQPFFIMDLVPGESLAEILKTRGRLTLNQAVKIFIQVGFALSHAHANGVIHRDIKPSNIMLQKEENDTSLAIVKVVDFGIAKLTGQDEFNQQTLTKTGEIFGSPLYMSPEQCMGIAVDHRSDLYSLGCVVYEAVTGAPPLVGDSALSTMMKHQSEEALSLKEGSLGIVFPQQIEQIVARLLAKDIQQRYQSAQYFTADLVAFDTGMHSDVAIMPLPSPVAIQPVVSWYHLRLVALYLCMLLAGVSVGYSSPHPEDKTPRIVFDDSLVAELDGSRTTREPAYKAAENYIHKTYTVNFVKSCDQKLTQLEKTPGYFSTIDKKKKLRVFQFPNFELGRIGDRQTFMATGTVTFPLSSTLSFIPTDLFRKHPLLFKKFRDDEIRSLTIKNKHDDMDFTSIEFSNTSKVLENITHFRYLQELNMISTDPTPEAWALVNSFPQLSRLSLSHVMLDCKEIAKFKRFKQLTYFKLIVPQKITAVVKQFQGSKKINNLCLVKCMLEDEDVRILSTCSNLAHLEMRSTNITDAAIPMLPPKLVSLDVSNCKITSASIPALARLKNLRGLAISTNLFSEADIRLLKNSLKNVQIKYCNALELGEASTSAKKPSHEPER